MNEQIVIVIFRLINFGVIVAIGVYLWKQYGKQAVSEAQHEAQETYSTLEKSYVYVQKEHRATKLERKKDENLQAVLKERLYQWRDAVIQEHQALDNLKAARMQALESTVQEQVARAAQYRLYQSIKSDALAQLKEQLASEYKDTDAQHRFLAKALREGASE